MKIEKFLAKPGEKINLAKFPTDDTTGYFEKIQC